MGVREDPMMMFFLLNSSTYNWGIEQMLVYLPEGLKLNANDEEFYNTVQTFQFSETHQQFCPHF